jgi:hypothetical protein
MDAVRAASASGKELSADMIDELRRLSARIKVIQPHSVKSWNGHNPGARIPPESTALCDLPSTLHIASTNSSLSLSF